MVPLKLKLHVCQLWSIKIVKCFHLGFWPLMHINIVCKHALVLYLNWVSYKTKCKMKIQSQTLSNVFAARVCVCVCVCVCLPLTLKLQPGSITIFSVFTCEDTTSFPAKDPTGTCQIMYYSTTARSWLLYVTFRQK